MTSSSSELHVLFTVNKKSMLKHLIWPSVSAILILLKKTLNNVLIRRYNLYLDNTDSLMCFLWYSLVKKQMAFQLARQQIYIETDDADLNACINNTNLSKYFLSLARELDVMEPKVPEDIYKSHLENHSK